MSDESKSHETPRSDPSEIPVGGQLIVKPKPEELCYLLRREEFEILDGGEVAREDAKWRDVLISVSLTSFFSLLAQGYATDWDDVFRTHRWSALILILIFGAAFLTATTVAIYVHRRAKANTETSSYKRIRSRILAHFEGTEKTR
jgi:hypothetical protein